jgi:gamma-glutamylcyclotransferase (GGCT)/AIG2-like uncharacterized protein YtfP
MPDRLFLYGTLRPASAPAEVRPAVAKLRRLGSGTVPGTLFDLGDYPGAIFRDDAESQVVGEVFDVPEDTDVMAALDDYEDFDPAEPTAGLFVRVRRPVRMSDGQTVECWVYEYNRSPDKSPVIVGGDYLRRPTALSPAGRPREARPR